MPIVSASPSMGVFGAHAALILFMAVSRCPRSRWDLDLAAPPATSRRVAPRST